jgi:hypothetical protein
MHAVGASSSMMKMVERLVYAPDGDFKARRVFWQLTDSTQ